MNKSKATGSLIAAACALVLLIVMCVIAGGIKKLPDNCQTVNSLLDACMDLSESKITKYFGNQVYTPNFSSCVTADDYLSACGISFDYMRDDSCKLTDVKFLGAEEVSDDDELLGYVSSNSGEISRVYITAEYTDGDGAERTAVSGFYVVSDSSGKIISIYD